MSAVQLLQMHNSRSRPMGTQAHAEHRAFIEMPPESSDTASPTISYESDADIEHSENNILQWIAYLPEDCIRTMVLMGWDITT
jgi:hypothetical protein